MPLALFLLIVALELLVAITIWAPAALPGGFARRPQLGIVVWLSSFILATILLAVAATVTLWLVVTEYRELSTVDLASTDLGRVLAVSFAPWVLLALAGISIALANRRLHIREDVAGLTSRLAVASQGFKWQGVEVLVAPLPVPLAGVIGRKIVISNAVDAMAPTLREAVLWHELAHIRLGHSAVRNLARLVARLLPGLSAATAMRAELDRLSELAADVWAAERCDPTALAAARQQFQEFLPTSVR